MIEFKPVRLEDRAVIERYTMQSGICNCDLAFANMYCWQQVYHSAWPFSILPPVTAKAPTMRAGQPFVWTVWKYCGATTTSILRMCG